MITGFNTDISYDGTTYHVQTEDKGESNPIIESLIYMRGAILAAKRTSYAKELEKGLAEEQLQGMLEKQHRTILAVIKAGRIQELVEKLNKPRAAQPTADVSIAIEPAPLQPQMPAPIPAAREYEPFEHEPIATVPAYTSGNLDIGSGKGDSQPLFAEFDLDKIIFDYLQTDAQEEKLEISLIGNSEFFAGENVMLQIAVTRGGTEPLPNIPVMAKIIGTAFKPQIYSGRTGADGIAVIPVTLPNFTAGSAAIVVQSSSEAGEAEIKQLIRRR